MKTTSKPATRSTAGSNGKAAPLVTETSSMPEHVPDIAAPEGAGAGAMTREERIRARAFEFYLARGDAPGNETEDWVAAEAQIAASEEQKQARSRIDTVGDASDVGEEDPGAADDDLQVSQSLRAEAAATAPQRAKRTKR